MHGIVTATNRGDTNSMKTKISKIVIEVAGKKLEFTPDEAKELKGILADLFGGKEYHTVYVDRWHNWPWYNQPYYGSLGGSSIHYCQQSALSGQQSALSGGSYSGQNWQGSLQNNVATFSAKACLTI